MLLHPILESRLTIYEYCVARVLMRNAPERVQIHTLEYLVVSTTT